MVTEQASYNHQSGIVNIPGHLTFSRGELEGSAIGAVYDNEGDQLHLFSESHVSLGRVAFTSKEAVLATSTLSFSKDVQIDEGVRKATAQAAHVQYDPIEASVKYVELREQAQMRTLSTKPGSLEVMKAQEIDLSYEEESGLLSQVRLMGDSEIGFAGSNQYAGEYMVAESIDVSLAGDDGVVASLEARRKVEIALHDEDEESTRKIRAGVMTVGGDGTGELSKMVFVEDVEYRSRGFVDADQQSLVITSDRLEASFTGRLGAMDSARFTGHVGFSNGDTEGVSESGVL